MLHIRNGETTPSLNRKLIAGGLAATILLAGGCGLPVGAESGQESQISYEPSVEILDTVTRASLFDRGSWATQKIVVMSAQFDPADRPSAEQRNAALRTTHDGMFMLHMATGAGVFQVHKVEEGADIALRRPADAPKDLCTSDGKDATDTAVTQALETLPAAQQAALEDAIKVVVVHYNETDCNPKTRHHTAAANFSTPEGLIVVYQPSIMESQIGPSLLAHELNHEVYGHDSSLICETNPDGATRVDPSCEVNEYGNYTTVAGLGQLGNADPEKLSGYEMDMIGAIAPSQIRTLEEGTHRLTLHELSNSGVHGTRIVRIPMKDLAIISNACNEQQMIFPEALYIEFSNGYIDVASGNAGEIMSVKAYLVDTKDPAKGAYHLPSTYLIPMGGSSANGGLTEFDSKNPTGQVQLGDKLVTIQLQAVDHGHKSGQANADITVGIQKIV